MARWRVNPILAYECARTARRWQTYAGRTAFLTLLLGGLISLWFLRFPDGTLHLTRKELTSIGEDFFFTVVEIQLALVLLAAPAYTAGAICIDKARGILDYLLITKLSASEIILGKLGARLLPVLGLILAGLPVLALAMLLGGIDPLILAGSFMVTVSVALVSCALAMTLSVWGSKTYEVMLVTYLLWIVVLLLLPGWFCLEFLSGLRLQAGWLEFAFQLFSDRPDLPRIGAPPAWLERSNPFWLCFAPQRQPNGVTLTDYLVFLVVGVIVASGLSTFAVVTLRKAAHRGKSRRRKPVLGRLHALDLRPLLVVNPVLWREWYSSRPSRWMLTVWGIYALISIGAVVYAVNKESLGDAQKAAMINAFLFSIGLLLVSVTSATALFEERVRGSLDTLLTTPLSTSSIVAGKWFGSFRIVLFVALLPSFLGFCLIDRHRYEDGWRFELVLLALLLTHGSLVNSAGLALATWMTSYGRAVGVSVVVCFLVIVGPFSLPSTRMFNSWEFLSPWDGVREATLQITQEGEMRLMARCIVSAIVNALVAYALVFATIKTFDRCLGRVTQRAARVGKSPR
jgi:ABC-type transport system involved in multi-copper enzyme maturation permease subunit